MSKKSGPSPTTLRLQEEAGQLERSASKREAWGCYVATVAADQVQRAVDEHTAAISQAKTSAAKAKAQKERDKFLEEAERKSLRFIG